MNHLFMYRGGYHDRLGVDHSREPAYHHTKPRWGHLKLVIKGMYRGDKVDRHTKKCIQIHCAEHQCYILMLKGELCTYSDWFIEQTTFCCMQSLNTFRQDTYRLDIPFLVMLYSVSVALYNDLAVMPPCWFITLHTPVFIDRYSFIFSLCVSLRL